MEIAKITSKGQMTVPKAVREKLDLGAGSKVVFIQVGDDLVVRNASSLTQSLVGQTHRETAELYRLSSDALPAFRRLQEAFEGFAEEEGLETEDDVVEWLERQRLEMTGEGDR